MNLALKTQPNNYNFYQIQRWLIRFYFETGNLELAKTYCQKALEMNPYEADTYRNLAEIAVNEKNFNAALLNIEKLVSLKYDASYINLISAYIYQTP